MGSFSEGLGQVMEKYKHICGNHPVLAKDLRNQILAYAEDKDEIHSKRDGHKIMKQWPRLKEFEALCDKWETPRVFGVFLQKTLMAADWEEGPKTANGESGVTYYSPEE